MSQFLKRPLRYLITRGDATDLNFPEKKKELTEIVRRASAAGIELVQLREKRLSAGRIYELTKAAVEAAAGSGTKILVNDRLDVALAAGADGVHLTTTSLPTATVRTLVPPEFAVARSTHSIEEILAERDAGADLVLFGPVFATPGKGEPTGLDRLKDACAAAGRVPVIAIGGIDDGSFESVLENGAGGYAAIRYLNEFVMIGA